MTLNIKTAVKLFLIFLFFQISINFFIENIDNLKPTLTTDETIYIQFLTAQTNGEIDGDSQAQTLLTNFRNSISTQNLFNDSIIDSFLGVLRVVGSVLSFLFQLILNILFTPSVFMNILLYNFAGTSSLLYSMTTIVNVFFYLTLFYIVFRSKTQST